MSTYTTSGLFSWVDRPVQWSAATSSSIDRSLSYTYSDYPLFDYRLNDTQHGLVRSAFGAWAAVSGITFEEVSDSMTADIRVGIDAIDGIDNTLGEATYWWTGSNSLDKASIAFDSADLSTAWTGSGPAPANTWSFYSTAVHEIGHAIGIGHLSQTDAIMYPYANNVSTLTTADIEQAVLRYGAAAATTVVPTASTTAITVSAAPAGGVDDAFYFSRYADVAAAGADAVTHYASHGWREGRDPTAWFDTSFYLNANADVAAAGINPFDHFQTSGSGEGRNPNSMFDMAWYLTNNPDVAAAGVNPITHYWSSGWRENRDPGPSFDTSAYLDANPDVRAAGINALEHWLMFGEAEGRALA